MLSIFKLIDAELSSISPIPMSDDTIYGKRTETAIKDLESKIESIVESKNYLVEQFSQEKNSLNKDHEKRLLAERQKHKACENNFKYVSRFRFYVINLKMIILYFQKRD